MSRDAREALALVRVRRMLADGRARQARERARLSQVEVAHALGVVPATVSRWESGQRVPETRHALAYDELLQAFETSESAPA